MPALTSALTWPANTWCTQRPPHVLYSPRQQKAKEIAQDKALARYQRKKEREEIARQEAEEAKRQERERLFAKMRAEQERIMDNRVRWGSRVLSCATLCDRHTADAQLTPDPNSRAYCLGGASP